MAPVRSDGEGTRPRSSALSLAELLSNPRWELAPVKDPLAETGDLPTDATVTVGCFAASERGFTVTYEIAESLRARGFAVVPHLPARSLRDDRHLDAVLDGYSAIGVRELFVVAGNADRPVGAFAGAVDVLRRIDARRAEFPDVGVAAYPESHPYLSDGDAIRLLREKQEYATYMVTQTCFDPRYVARWLKEFRCAGVTLPVHIGVAGAVERKELVRLATWMGVGNSLRFLRKQRKAARHFLAPGAYDPSDMVAGLVEHAGHPEHGIAGLHLNTFNQISMTRRWWEQLMKQEDPGKRRQLDERRRTL